MLQGVRERLSLVLGVALVLVVAVAVVVGREATDGPPFRLADMHARITNVTVLPDNTVAQSALDRLAGKGSLNLGLAPGRPPIVLGQLDYEVAAPRGTGGELVLFVIDARAHRCVRNLWGVGPSGSNVAQGWDGRFQRLADKYEWLAPLAEQKTESGYVDPGMAIVTRPAVRGPITFEAVTFNNALPVTDPAHQLTFVLAYVGDSSGAWAERVPVASG